MATKIKCNVILFKQVISELSIQMNNIDRIIDEILCIYFKTSNDNLYNIIDNILHKQMMVYDDKINIVKFIAYIKCPEINRDVIIESIDVARKCNRIKRLMVYEKTLLCGNKNSYYVKTVSRIYNGNILHITPTTFIIIQETVEKAILELNNAKKYFL